MKTEEIINLINEEFFTRFAGPRPSSPPDYSGLTTTNYDFPMGTDRSVITTAYMGNDLFYTAPFESNTKLNKKKGK